MHQVTKEIQIFFFNDKKKRSMQSCVVIVVQLLPSSLAFAALLSTMATVRKTTCSEKNIVHS